MRGTVIGSFKAYCRTKNKQIALEAQAKHAGSVVRFNIFDGYLYVVPFDDRDAPGMIENTSCHN